MISTKDHPKESPDGLSLFNIISKPSALLHGDKRLSPVSSHQRTVVSPMIRGMVMILARVLRQTSQTALR